MGNLNLLDLKPEPKLESRNPSNLHLRLQNVWIQNVTALECVLNGQPENSSIAIYAMQQKSAWIETRLRVL